MIIININNYSKKRFNAWNRGDPQSDHKHQVAT